MNAKIIKYLQNHLPFYNDLNTSEQKMLNNSIRLIKYRPKETVYRGLEDCTGLYLITKGELRTYIISETGRELTVFRLFEYDICLFSASCLLKDIDFDLIVTAQTDTEAILIPNIVFDQLMNNIKVLSFTNRLISSRFSDVMFLIRQIIFSRFDRRLANFLIEQAAISGDNHIKITHEAIANHIASAREVVTRMLKYFQNEKIIKLARGKIEIIDFDRLNKIGAK